jgi:hypothetical protein
MKSLQSKLDVRVLFILGVALIPVGIALNVIALTAVGGLCFIAALANREVWSKE